MKKMEELQQEFVNTCATLGTLRLQQHLIKTQIKVMLAKSKELNDLLGVEMQKINAAAEAKGPDTNKIVEVKNFKKPEKHPERNDQDPETP